MSSRLKALLILLILVAGIFLIDSLLPAEELTTTIARSEAGSLVYNLPDSGGEEVVCSPRKKNLLPLPAQTLVVIQKTALFGFCISAIPVPGEVLTCLSKQAEHIYWQAVEFEKQRALAQAHDHFAAVCSVVYSSVSLGEAKAEQGNPCQASLRLYKKTHEAYSAVLAALENFKSRTGHYPDSLSAVQADLTPAMQEMVQGFSYCKKVIPGDSTAPCSDGAVSFADSEISVATGLNKYLPALEKSLSISQFQHCWIPDTAK
ncbi:hypothetical protein ACO0LD_19065 [Undibacterium sp. Ji83W]|uniref:hypothetical protein n=1 Tax=Undibacterium sp. Ji83W TaxID=3413043 RepID=UPI003BF37B16